MKKSILFSLLILVFASLGFWCLHRSQLETAEAYEKLLERAAELGVTTIGEAGGQAEAAKTALRDPGRRDEEARSLARQMIESAMQADEEGKVDRALIEQTRTEELELADRTLALDQRQLRVLVEEILGAGELDDLRLASLLSHVVVTLIDEHPEAALALWSEVPDLAESLTPCGLDFVAMAVSGLAAKDPMRVLAWVREALDDRPELVDDTVKSTLVTGLLAEDPGMALDLMDELGLDQRSMGNALGWSLGKGVPGSALMAALRERGEDELMEVVLLVAGRNLARGGFDSGREWMETAALSDEDLAEFAVGVSKSVVGEETGRWIEWIDDTRGGMGQVQVERLMSSWTEQDYRAAGAWLREREAGPLRDAAVAGFAARVAPYDPQAAVLWVDTLPPGEGRLQAAERVHRELQRNDEAAAADFARREGLR